MTRVNAKLALLFLLLLLALPGQQRTGQAAAGSGADPGQSQIDGAWALSLDDAHQSSYKFDSRLPGKKVMLFRTDGEFLHVSDPETKETSKTKAQGGTAVSFTLPVKSESSGDVKSVVFHGSLNGSTLLGTMSVDGVDVQWKAVKLASVWECSNHKNPAHVATTEEEMQALTKKYNCMGWHKLKPGNDSADF